ncbi:uncharacterized protein LOC134672044 [Cydia fagiglandana]|uniref:uncharacterized protein LOC134672044 n=1 Tax=Cydia fagiglandana TaxID=1458189 RepID=UPI002FEE28D3
MIDMLQNVFSELKEIRRYLIKVGPSKRKGNLVAKKLSEANILFSQYTSIKEHLSVEIGKGNIGKEDAILINKFSVDFIDLYKEITDLCTVQEESMSENMDTFNLKTALSLMPQMTDDEESIKCLIDNLEYYASLLKSNDCKKNLILFILKSRLSQAAKLKLKSSYDAVDSLITDMKQVLLPQKSATAIQNKLQQIKQNDMSIQDYGKEIAELFVELTISQAEGKPENYNVLKPLNEKMATKRFADGLRNRRLSTIIAARNFTSLKDAIQSAKDEETSSATPVEEAMRTYRPHNNYSHRSRQGHRGGPRGQYNTRVYSNRNSRGNPNSYSTRQHRGGPSGFQHAPQRGNHSRYPRPSRGKYNNYSARGNQGMRGGQMRVMSDSVNSQNRNNHENENTFFRD